MPRKPPNEILIKEDHAVLVIYFRDWSESNRVLISLEEC